MAIYPPASSYISRAMQDKNSSGSSTSSQSSSKTKFKYTPPRPRPLFIDKPLQQLSKEDPATYALFLEGATLLAWDVAWLCRTQGININSDSWEEVCDIGKSMYQLLIAPPTQPSTLTKAMASRNPGSDSPTKGKSPAKDNPQPSNNNQRTKLLPILGHYSHGTAHSSLAAFEGSEYMRSWKLPTPTKIVDKLKASLHGDMSNAEWELLEVNEWDDRPPESDQTLPAGAAIQRSSTPTSSTTIRPNGGDNNEPSGQGVDDTPRSRGNSGWMKLNNR